MSVSSLIVLIHPSFILLFLSGITKSSDICNFTPNPLHSGHAPKGALKLNSLGSNSGREKSQCGHANFSDITISFELSPNTLIITFPSLNLVAASIDSNSLVLIPSFITILSITTSISSFIFLSSVISSDRSTISLLILALIYPCFLKSSSKSL